MKLEKRVNLFPPHELNFRQWCIILKILSTKFNNTLDFKLLISDSAAMNTILENANVFGAFFEDFLPKKMIQATEQENGRESNTSSGN